MIAQVGAVEVKVAVTEVAAFTVTVHVPVPLHAPLQPVNVEAPSGAAVRVTTVPESNGALHVVPQLIPAGLEVTVPFPVPALLTERVTLETEGLLSSTENVALS
jgi:hypothetical protein